MKKLVFLFILFLLIISSCYTQKEEIKPVQNIVIEENQTKTKELQQEVTKLKEELEKIKPHVFDYKADLTVWTEDEIVNGLAKRNKRFQNTRWFTYQYNDDGRYYDIIGPMFPVDLFYSIVYEKRNRELNVSGLRIFNLDPGEKGLAEEKYKKYLASIDKAARLDKNLNCLEQTDCRETKLLTCTSGNQTIYIWYAYPYLMQSRNDKQDAYKTFLELYCEESKSGLLDFTGSIIRSIKSFFK